MPARQVLGALHLVKPSMKFSDAGSVAASQQALGGNGGDAGSLAVVPNLYLASPLGSDWSLGFGSPRLGVW
jgi:long-chain fatty acid transport protein